MYIVQRSGATYPSNVLPVLLEQKKAIIIISRAKYLDHTKKFFGYMNLLTINQIIELQSLTFMHKAFKGLLSINLQTHLNLNIDIKRYQNNIKCQYSRITKKQHCLSFIGVKLCNKTDKWILNRNKIHLLKNIRIT